ncbi:MAG: NADH-quinone oxidoreductase subunit J [Opitutales bacterium]
MTIAALILIALGTLGAAAVAMALRNLIHSALLLILSWAGVAAFYLWAGADFVAFAQALIYVGAVSMVVLFAVLLTRQNPTGATFTTAATLRTSWALLAAFGVLGILCGAVLGTNLETDPGAPAPSVPVKQLGLELMGRHTASLLVVGVILTVALLGAIILAAAQRQEGES